MRNLHDEDSSAHFSREDLSFLISQIVDNEMHNSMVDGKNIKGRKREFLHSHPSEVFAKMWKFFIFLLTLCQRAKKRRGNSLNLWSHVNFNDGANLKFPRCNQKQVCNFSLKELFRHRDLHIKWKQTTRNFKAIAQRQLREFFNHGGIACLIIFNCNAGSCRICHQEDWLKNLKFARKVS